MVASERKGREEQMIRMTSSEAVVRSKPVSDER